MHLRNGDGYGLVTRSLHWLTFTALVGQLVVGYLIDDSGHGRGRGRGGDSGRGRGRGGEVDLDDLAVRIHIALGLVIIALALSRVVWRRATPLPPWSERLSERDRWVESKLELVLLSLLFLTPATGLTLVIGEDDLLPLHVACHVALYVAVALHVGLAVRRRTLGRMLGRTPARTPVRTPTAST